MKKCAPGRIINVSALAHKMIKTIDVTDLNCEKTGNILSFYAKSKALQILFTRELSRQLKRTGLLLTLFMPFYCFIDFVD